LYNSDGQKLELWEVSAMSETRLMESTLQFLEEPLLGEQDLDTKILLLLEAEYLRRLGRYRRLDRVMTQEYGMTFEEFMERRVVQQKGYTHQNRFDKRKQKGYTILRV
jgi:hypothetical protein